MKWLLILIIAVQGYREGSAAVETQYFQTEAQCEIAARTFLNDMDLEREYKIQRKATCIRLR